MSSPFLCPISVSISGSLVYTLIQNGVVRGLLTLSELDLLSDNTRATRIFDVCAQKKNNNLHSVFELNLVSLRDFESF